MILLILLYTLISISFQDPNAHIYHKCTQLSFLPMPKSIKCNLEDQTRHEIKDPCDIMYLLKTEGNEEDLSHIQQLIEDQQYKTFRCKQIYFETSEQEAKKSKHDIVVQIQLTDRRLKSAFTQKQQSYSTKINRNNAQIKASHYVGFVRGLETFLQSIICSKRYINCHMIALPIQIEDQPIFSYRGLLVDTSRHFIPMNLLYETIDAMMYNKLNVFHWHIVDEDSFPLELESHPEFAEYASFSIYEKYSLKEVRQFIHYAMIRGVRVIPEIDTPGHAVSWSFAPQNKQIACLMKDNLFQGPLDVTLHKTYEVMKEVFKEIFQLFPDPYVHVGGDQVVITCLANKTEFLRLENIQQKNIEMQYRKKQKKILRELNATKKFIYWINDDITPIQQDDIVHWWGKKTLTSPIKNRKIILSPSIGTGQFYIDMGSGGRFGRPYYNYSTWFNMYKINLGKQIKDLQYKQNFLGPTITLWTELSNMYTHHVKIWIRSSSMAERAWTDQEHEARFDFFRRLTTHQKLMNRRGIPTAPVTCQICQLHPQFC